MATAKWNEKRRHWDCAVWIEGKSRHFYSGTPGKAGKKEAEEKAQLAKEESQYADARFSVACGRFLEHMEAHTGYGTYRTAKSLLETHFIPVLGDMKLSAIRNRHWQRIIDTAMEKGLSMKMLENIRGMMSNFTGWAKKNDYLIQDPDVYLPKTAPVGEKRAATGEELRTLFSRDTIILRNEEVQDWYIHAYRFIVLTGLRRGELAGIQEEDIQDNVLTIRRSIDKWQKVTAGKTKKAQRRIGLGALSLEVLRLQHEQKKKAGILSPWLFCGEDGQCMDPNHLYKHWRLYYGPHNGIDLTLHELRHTFISAMKSDMPEELLKNIVDHTVKMDTTGIYGHEFDGDMKRSSSLIDEVFSRYQDGKTLHNIAT